jgi:hypothetical protein
MLNLDYTLEFGALVPIKVEVTQEDSAVWPKCFFYHWQAHSQLFPSDHSWLPPRFQVDCSYSVVKLMWSAQKHCPFHLWRERHLIKVAGISAQEEDAISRESVARNKVVLLDEPRDQEELVHESVSDFLETNKVSVAVHNDLHDGLESLLPVKDIHPDVVCQAPHAIIFVFFCRYHSRFPFVPWPLTPTVAIGRYPVRFAFFPLRSNCLTRINC